MGRFKYVARMKPIAEPLAVVGAGYVGLVTGCCLAHLGYPVTIVENSKKKLQMLKQGQCPIYEAGLSELLREGIETGRLFFVSSITELFVNSPVRFVFLAVGTPSQPDGITNLTDLMQAVELILTHLHGPTTIIVKSTVPVGTAARINDLIQSKSVPYPVTVASNPEFLREGRAIHDFMRPDRVVVGAKDTATQLAVAAIYKTLERQDHRIILTSNEEAELAKYASNIMLASRITMMNQIARFCERRKINIHQIREIVGSDSRIGNEYLHASLGYGGSCLPKDVASFIQQCKDCSADASFAEAIQKFNDDQKSYFLPLIREAFPDPHSTSIGVLGLAFKAETDDIRQSVALALIPSLVKAGYSLKLHDPKAMANFQLASEIVNGDRVRYCDHVTDVLDKSDALLILTEWQEYRRLTPEVLAQHMAGRMVFDGRNMLNRQTFNTLGFTIKGVGW